MRFLRWLLIVLLLGAVGGAAWVWRWLDRPLPLATATVELSIEPGATPREVANAWVRAGVRVAPVMLYEWFRWSGDARRIRAGSYVAGPDVTPRQLLRIAGDSLPSGYRRSLERYRYGMGAFKVDWALKEPIPWRSPRCAEAITVHLGALPQEIEASERAAWAGGLCERPFVLLAQPSLFDRDRAPAGRL